MRMVSPEVEVLSRLGDETRAVRYSDRLHGHFGIHLWSLVKLRKPAVCVVTNRKLDKGEWAWRPVGNQMYRMVRIAKEVLE